MSTLVIVESPTKARTIRNFLPSEYQVEASMGHIRDLPASASEIPASYKGKSWANLGVDVENNFDPIYVIPKDKKKVVQGLKTALKSVDELILATDEDREGESISWHLLQILKPKVPIKRMVFHEITKDAIQESLENCRDINENLVHAQETRRVLDRLYGYTLSPLLWKKIAWGLSAGRVQSVAVRLLVQKERERLSFQSGEYWNLKVLLKKEEIFFEAKLISISGKKIAIGSDFDPKTGGLAGNRNIILLDEQEANILKEQLKDTNKTWNVVKVEEKKVSNKPFPPFTTSTLQQESNRKLGISARDTMRIAQKLYEEGYITYMRTDSVNLSSEAINAARKCVKKKYGEEFLSPHPRKYTTVSKGAQEAHEAIRPAGNIFLIPKETGLTDQRLSLYDLIWKRTVACQMADAQLTQVSVIIAVENAEFRAYGKRIDFPGFFRAYVEGSDNPEIALENQEIILPYLQEGEHLKCEQVDAISHKTQPPARYTEASLVKILEKEGIGRPSTYASIIGTICDRGYSQMRSKALVPTFTAFAVVSLLETYFPELVDPMFTSKMEQALDEIATGEVLRVPYLEKFYFGDKGLDTQVKVRTDEINPSLAKAINLHNLDTTIKIGKFGPYIEVEQNEKIITASIPADLTPSDLNIDQVTKILKQKTEGPEKIGLHPDIGEPIYLLIGSYGPYVQLGEITEENKKPKRTSLPKSIKPEDVNLEIALGLLALPRLLGTHPDTQASIKVNIGRFGSYVVHDQGKEGKDYRSLKKEDDLLTISFERALELLSQPKLTRGRRTKKPLKELGLHPEDNEPINIYEGPYGVYINHKKINVSLSKKDKIDDITLEKALKLLLKKTPAKKTTAKKATAKKATAKKATEIEKSTATKKSTAAKKSKKD